MKKNKSSKAEKEINKELFRPIEVRLDALISLFIEMSKPESKRDLSEANIARILKSIGFSPTEIAKILGKKSRTDVSQYIYSKKKDVKK